jgi:hypothetical protein
MTNILKKISITCIFIFLFQNANAFDTLYINKYNYFCKLFEVFKNKKDIGYTRISFPVILDGKDRKIVVTFRKFSALIKVLKKEPSTLRSDSMAAFTLKALYQEKLVLTSSLCDSVFGRNMNLQSGYQLINYDILSPLSKNKYEVELKRMGKTKFFAKYCYPPEKDFNFYQIKGWDAQSNLVDALFKLDFLCIQFNNDGDPRCYIVPFNTTSIYPFNKQYYNLENE